MVAEQNDELKQLKLALQKLQHDVCILQHDVCTCILHVQHDVCTCTYIFTT